MEVKVQEMGERFFWARRGMRGFSAIEALAMLAVVGVLAMLIAGVVKQRQAAGESVWSWPTGDGARAVPAEVQEPAGGAEERDQGEGEEAGAIDRGEVGEREESEIESGSNESGAESGEGGPDAG